MDVTALTPYRRLLSIPENKAVLDERMVIPGGKAAGEALTWCVILIFATYSWLLQRGFSYRGRYKSARPQSSPAVECNNETDELSTLSRQTDADNLHFRPTKPIHAANLANPP